jgi:hypothetical protein
MSEDVFERIRRGLGSQESGATQRGDGLHSPKDIKLPAVSLSQRVWSPSVPVPEVKALSNDRRGRREASEMQRELARIATQATKFGVALQAVRSVNTFVVYSADQGQSDMMEILMGRSRHEGMNETMAAVVLQSLQQMIAQMLALAEQHFKRQMEAL